MSGSNVVVGGTTTNAVDSGADAAYRPIWTNGNNGGTGFLGWIFNHNQGTGYAGCFVGDPAKAGITGFGTNAFGFYANPPGSGANAEVIRNFGAAMAVGSTFSFDWGLNWDSDASNSYRGCSLLAGDVELVYINMGNSAAISINGSPMFTNYGAQAMALRFEYVADGSIRVRGTGRNGTEAYDQTLAVPAGAPSRIKFYFNASSVPDSPNQDNRQMYVDNLKVTTPSAGGTETHTDFVIVTRQSGGAPPVIADMDLHGGGGGMGFSLGTSVSGETYAIWASPTLFPSQNWQKVAGTESNADGGPIDLTITNGLLPTNFFRVGYGQD